VVAELDEIRVIARPAALRAQGDAVSVEALR